MQGKAFSTLTTAQAMPFSDKPAKDSCASAKLASLFIELKRKMCCCDVMIVHLASFGRVTVGKGITHSVSLCLVFRNFANQSCSWPYF